MLISARSDILKSGLMLVAVTLAVDVNSNNMNEATSDSAQDGNNYAACSIHTSEKTVILNCSGVSIKNEIFETLDQHVNVLDVSYTGLTSLAAFDKEDFLKDLLVLNASHNSIKHINEGILRKMPYLEKIDLSFNIIEQIPDDTFISLSELAFLDLSNNKLTSLPNRLPMTEWFDISNNEISSISEVYTSVLYPQTVFLVGQNPFTCTCDMMWLKDLISTRKYLLKVVQHLDSRKFIPVCSLPDHLAGKSWLNLEDEEFKCTGLAENYFESPAEKLSSPVQEVKISVSEIGHNSIILKWNGDLDGSGKILDIKFHKFGESKEPKQVTLPLSVSSYRLRNLEAETPYVVCFTVLLEPDSVSLGCKEIFTTVIPVQSSFTYPWRYFIHLVDDNLNYLLALLTLLITTVYMVQRNVHNTEKINE